MRRVLSMEGKGRVESHKVPKAILRRIERKEEKCKVSSELPAVD